MSFPKEDRKTQSVSGTSFPPGRFADAIASALHKEYGETHAAIKTVVGLTGANERAVKNWFAGKNGPSGHSLVALCRHSNQVLDTFLRLAGRNDHVRARALVGLKDTLLRMLALASAIDDE
jgi:hypothetical protein